MLGAGAAIGVSIFSVLAPAARVAGSGLLAAVLVAALPMGVFAFVYAYMGSIAPRSGASYEWPRALIHPFAGFMVAWLRIVGSVGVLVTLSLVLVRQFGAVIPAPAQRPAMAAVLLVIYLANVRGLAIAARAQTAAMAALLLAFALFVVTGLAHATLARIGDPMALGWRPILMATPLMIPLFLGLETSTEVGEEVRDAARTIPAALALALGLTVAVYLAVAATALGLLGPAGLAASPAPLTDAARGVAGGLAAPVMLAAAVLALAKSLNSVFIVFSRYLFAMARAGVLPGVFARVHGRWGTPHWAASLAFGLALVGLALPRDLVFLLVAISVPTVLKYASTSLCAWRVWRAEPRLARSSPLRLGPCIVKIAAATGVACALLILALGLTTEWRAPALVAAWGAVGALYWLVLRLRPRAVR